jgi:hypothetical protein
MKTFARALLVGFLASVAPGAGAAPLPCCGTECPACAPVFCKEVPALSAVKAPALATIPAVSVAAFRLDQGFAATEPFHVLLLITGSAGFLRPMRN